AIDRTTLQFALTGAGTIAPVVSSPQVVRLTQQGSGAVAWKAASNLPWVTVAPASGTGTAALTIGIEPAHVPGGTGTFTASVTIHGPHGIGVAAPVTGPLRSISATAVAAPTGSFDTPFDGTGGLNGSIAVTGWALDDIEVMRVRILRDPVAGEAPGALVF